MTKLVFDLLVRWVYPIFSSIHQLISANLQNATSSDAVGELATGGNGARIQEVANDAEAGEENSEPRVIHIENKGGIVVVGDGATINGTKGKKNERVLSQIKNESLGSKNQTKPKRRRKKKSDEMSTNTSPSKQPAVVRRFHEADKSLSTLRGNGEWEAHKNAIQELHRLYARDEDNLVIILLLKYEEAAAFCDKNDIETAIKLVTKLGKAMKQSVTQRSNLEHINDIRLVIYCKCLFLASKLRCIEKNFGIAMKALVNVNEMELSQYNNVELKAQFHLASAYFQLSVNQSHCTSEPRALWSEADQVIGHTNDAENVCANLKHEKYEKITRKILLLRCKAIIQFYQDGGDEEEFATVLNDSIKELESHKLWRGISCREKVDFEMIKSNYFNIHGNQAQALNHAEVALQIAQECEFNHEVSVLNDQIRKFPQDLVNVSRRDGVENVISIQTTTDGHGESNAGEMPDHGVFSTDDSDWDTFDLSRQNGHVQVMPQIEEYEEEIDKLVGL